MIWSFQHWIASKLLHRGLNSRSPYSSKLGVPLTWAPGWPGLFIRTWCDLPVVHHHQRPGGEKARLFIEYCLSRQMDSKGIGIYLGFIWRRKRKSKFCKPRRKRNPISAKAIWIEAREQEWFYFQALQIPVLREHWSPQTIQVKHDTKKAKKKKKGKKLTQFRGEK